MQIFQLSISLLRDKKKKEWFETLWTTVEIEDWWIHNKLLPSQEVVAGVHFKISLSIFFRQPFPTFPSHALRLIFYLTADLLVCVGVEGWLRWIQQWK